MKIRVKPIYYTYYGPCIKVIKWYHLWEDLDHKNSDTRFYVKAFFICSALTVPTITGLCLAFMKAESAMNRIKISAWILCWTCWALSTLLCVGNIRRGQNILIKMCLHFPKTDRFKNMVELQQRVVLGTQIIMVVVVIAITVFAMVDKQACIARAATQLQAETCGFVLPIWLPFNYYDFPMNYAVLFSHMIGAFTVMSTLSTLSYIAVFTAIYIGESLNYLGIILKTVSGRRSRICNLRKLQYFIQYHQNLLLLWDGIEKIGSLSILTVVVHIAIIFGILGFHFVVSHAVTSLLILLIWFVSFLCLTTTAQHLLDKTNELRESVYNIRWYELDGHSKFIILMILMRTEKPIKYSIGGYGTLSSRTAVAVFQLALSYITTLTSTFDNNIMKL